MSLLARVAGLARRMIPTAKPSQPRASETRAGAPGSAAKAPPSAPRAATPPADRLRAADEATIRHRAEAELGGTSSEESRRAWERGENPGGLHHRGHGPTAPQRGAADLASALDPAERGESN